MATLVLTAAGGIVGGPIGAAVGGLIGQTVDRAVLFAPPARQGPRLTELAVQTSSYGTPIPKLFGTIRVAGTVIWSTDLIERVTEDEGGKGAPDTVRYRYSASFAVLLSARPIRRVRRIWADGKLLRGAAGDLKTPVTLRVHRGGEDQAPDPLIAAERGIGTVPAHRGHAYAVFEEMELADYANRIPSLTFEVEADAGDCDAGDIAAELSGGRVVAADPMLKLGGYSAHGGSQRAVIEALASAGGGWFAPDRDVLMLRSGEGEGDAMPVEDAGIGGDGTRGKRTIEPADTAPVQVSVRHYDALRDYQAGVQQARRPGAGWRTATIDLPAVVPAATAKAIAAATIVRSDRDRVRRVVLPGDAALTIVPGDRVAIAGEGGIWRVRRFAIEAMAVTLDLSPLAPIGIADAPVSSGAVVGDRDLIHGPTRIEAFEYAPQDAAADRAVVAIAATGEGAGWRRAALMASGGGEPEWRAIGSTPGPATIGTVTVPPGRASAMIEDRIHAIEVTMAHAALMLADADARRIDGGANLAMVGDELVQFARAEPLGGGRWRLSGLWRGRQGTETAIAEHRVGERFVLIDAARLATIALSPAAIGSQLMVAASGVGDGVGPAEASVAIAGRSLLPHAPVHPRWSGVGTSAMRLAWTRRSRTGWRWVDGIDAPIGEERERYRVEVSTGGAAIDAVETDRPHIDLPPAWIGTGHSVAVRQLGTHGVSAPLTLSIPISGEPE